MDAVDTLDAIAADPEFYERVVYRTNLPARVTRTAPLTTSLHPDLVARLTSQGVTELYTHQAQAVDRSRLFPLKQSDQFGERLGLAAPM